VPSRVVRLPSSGSDQSEASDDESGNHEDENY